MELCSVCGKIVVERDANHNIVTAHPHSTCRACGATSCAECATKAKCPVCGFRG